MSYRVALPAVQHSKEADDQFTFIDDLFLIRVGDDLTEMPVDATALLRNSFSIW